MRRLIWNPRVLVAAAAATVAAATGTAQAAKPIVPGATPLTMIGPYPAGECPPQGSLDGTTLERLIGQELRRRHPSANRIFTSLSVVPSPVLLACDPDAVARNGWVGAFGGTSELTLHDTAWWGQRGLVGNAESGGPSALRVGDHVTLPALGQNGRFTAVVATSTGAGAVTVSASGATPTALDVTGSAAAPVVRITRSGGTTDDHPVAVRPAAPVRVRASTRRGRLQVALRARAWSFAVLVGASSRRARTALGSAGRGGRATLSLPLRASDHALQLTVVSLSDRVVTMLNCRVRGRRSGAVHCTRRGPRARPGVIGMGARSSLARTADAPTGTRRRKTSVAARRRAARTARSAHAGRPLATVPATLTTAVHTNVRVEAQLYPGDLNGDGRPDFLTSKDGVPGALAISTGDTWTGVRIRYPSGVLLEPLPDVSGDGRAELPTASEAMITDAFPPGAPLPTSIDMTDQRQPSPNDLVGAPFDDGSFELSLLWGQTPVGAIADETGDGRGELVIGDTDPIVLPSEAYPLGRQARLAFLTPIAAITPARFAGLRTSFEVGDDALELDSAKRTLSSRVIQSRLWTVGPVDRTAPARLARPMVLRQVGASGQVLSERRFTAAGVPQLLDVDTTSGDALVRMRSPKACHSGSNPFASGRHATCVDHLARITPDGTVLTSIAVPRGGDAVAAGGFLPRAGSASPDVVVWLHSTSSTRPPETATAPLSEGTIAVARSELRGDQPVAALPVLAENDTPLQSVSDTALVVLPDGSRWFAGDFVPPGDGLGAVPGRYALVRLG